MKRGEFALIDRFVAPFDRPSGPLVLGPGDDAAILRPRAGHELVLTVDAQVEGVHFTRDFTPAQIGHKALAVNLSDLAAMGARPTLFLCALAFPPAWMKALPAIAGGMSKLARAHGCLLAGGNMTRAERLSLTVTALGEVKRGHALCRSGARPGDVLIVSGALGGAAAGLRDPGRRSLRARQRLPEPRIALGLAVRDRASAGIDVSDGLVQDLGHLLDASGVGAKLDVSKIPLEPGATLEEALQGGEDYELLLAVPPSRVRALLRLGAPGVPLTAIGEVVGERRLALAGSKRIGPKGFDHFR